jgi:hypothetical protein
VSQGKAYYAQYTRALARNIEWHFTFESWLAWWGEDYQYRGRTKGKLVMARRGDQGPYNIDNCIKLTCGENVSQAQKGKTLSQEQRDILKQFAGRKSAEAYRKSSLKQTGKVKHNTNSKEQIGQAQRKQIKTPWGMFNSLKDAALHKNISPQRLNGWIKSNPNDYQYL